jgi:hypothetical protein
MPVMVGCRASGKTIAQDATACPHCGEPQRQTEQVSAPKPLRFELVPLERDALHESRRAAPGSQGATTAPIGCMQGRSNAASRDARE